MLKGFQVFILYYAFNMFLWLKMFSGEILSFDEIYDFFVIAHDCSHHSPGGYLPAHFGHVTISHKSKSFYLAAISSLPWRRPKKLKGVNSLIISPFWVPQPSSFLPFLTLCLAHAGDRGHYQFSGDHVIDVSELQGETQHTQRPQPWSTSAWWISSVQLVTYSLRSWQSISGVISLHRFQGCIKDRR